MNVHANVLDAGSPPGPRLVNAGAVFSSAATDASGLKAIQTETQNAVVPTPGTPDLVVDPAGDESYGKGAALELGLGNDIPDENADQLALSGRAEAAALPLKQSPAAPGTGANANSTGLVQSEDVVIPADPLAYVNALPNQAGATWNDRTCILGQPLSYGRGRAATVQAVDAAADPNSPDLDSPLVNVSQDFFGTPGRGAADSRSFTYLVNNGDGTFGVASETRMTFAPIGLLQTDAAAPAPIIIEVLGEWTFRAVATGKPGGASVSYSVNYPSDDPDPAIIKGYIGVSDLTAVPTFEIKRSQLFTDTGINVPAAPLADLTIGEDARPIDTDPSDGIVPDAILTAPPTTSADGTLASGAADVVRLDALVPGGGVEVAGLRVGHMESKAQVPAGGFKCTIPVSKTGPASASAGDTITWTIKVPSDPDALLGLACDLVNITVKDTISTLEGNASGNIISISGQGKSAGGNGKTATLSGLGPYKVGDPPIEVTVTAKLTGSGKLENTADVTANLANCGSGALAGQITGFADLAKVTGTADVLGTATVEGTGKAGGTTVAVLAARLPTTGGTNPLFTGLGIAALLSAAGVYVLRRKVGTSTTS